VVITAYFVISSGLAYENLVTKHTS